MTGIGEYISSNYSPEAVNGALSSFTLKDLLPGSTTLIQLLYHSPGVDQIALGTELEMSLKSRLTNKLGSSVYEHDETQELTFLCSYDPNDKQVSPGGLFDENFTLFDEGELNYHIRFQNTGNYFAEDVVIRDTLDQNFDLFTFRFIAASHDITQVILEDRSIAFVFDNIFLPDSTLNEPDSHGYVKYAITPKEEISENTVIKNTAHIYFDSNPAIVTNTVTNTMVSEYPNS